MPAFLVPAYWAVYRKLYREGAVIWGGQALLMLAGAFLISNIVNASAVTIVYSVYAFLLGAVIAVISGLFANRIYYGYCQKVMKEAEQAGENGGVILQKKGGVTKTGPFAGILAGMLVISGLCGALAGMLISDAQDSGSSSSYDYSYPSSGGASAPNPAYAMDDSGTTMDQEALTEEEALAAVQESYFDNGEVETEAFEELFPAVYPDGEWETDEDDEGILVSYSGTGYSPASYQQETYRYVFLVAGDSVDFSEVSIGDRSLYDEDIDAALAYADICYDTIRDGKSGVMDILSTDDGNPSTLDEAEYFLQAAGIGYSVEMNVSGEKANVVLEDDSRMIFFANRSDYLEGAEAYILTIKDEEMNVSTFQKYFYNTEPQPDYSYYGMDSAGAVNASDLADMTQTDLYIMRNEVFALHGRKFDDPFLRAVFSFTNWYSPTYEPEEFPDVLSSVEKANVSTIQSVEEEKGYWGDWEFW